MNILAVDDEQIMLSELVTELQKVFPNANIHEEMNSVAAAEWVKQLAEKNNSLEYAFWISVCGE